MSPAALNVVYILLDFPIRSERFIAREIRALQQLGVGVRVVTLRARAGDDTAEPVAGLDLWRPPPWWSLRLWVAALLAATGRPMATIRLISVAWALGGKEGRRGRSRALRLAVLALYFVRGLNQHPPPVIHGHFASAPATLALLIASWSALPWGFSCHASDVYAEPVDLRI